MPLAAPVRRRGLQATLGACALLVLATVAPAAAQGVRLRGEVRVATNGDSVPLQGAWVLLHEVTMAAGGARDSMRTDARGRFDLRLAQVDTAALYMVSTTYRGITYFSEAVTHAMSQDTVAPLVVFDTSSTSPPVTVAQRHIVVRGAGPTGGHGVLELIGLDNNGDRTRVAGDPPRHGAAQPGAGRAILHRSLCPGI